MKKIKTLAAILAAALFAAGPASAHDNATLEGTKTPNGGQIRMAGIYHLELVLAKNGTETKDSPIMVYVTDHGGAKIPTAGASAIVSILVGTKKITGVLTPDGDNRLKGRAKYASAHDLKAVVSFTPLGKESVMAQFTPLANQAHE